MTKKDFVATAKMIASMEDRNEAKKFAKNFASISAESNPAFNYARFYSACNVDIKS